MKENHKKNTWIIRPIVPEEVYTDRTEFLEYFYHAALEAVIQREAKNTATIPIKLMRSGK